jgi:hypothetical protein
MSESAANFILSKAKNLPARHPRWQAGAAQDKICRLWPFDGPVEQVY